MQATCFQSPCADLYALAPLRDSMPAETLNGRWFAVDTTRTSSANPGNAGWSQAGPLGNLFNFAVDLLCAFRINDS